MEQKQNERADHEESRKAKLASNIKQGLFHLSYPVLGGLSRKLQERIEKTTHGKYDAWKAFVISTYVDIPIYMAFFGFCCENLGGDSIERAVYGGVCLGLGESFYRYMYGYDPIGRAIFPEKRCEFTARDTYASSFGKILSYPIEGVLGIYDIMKKIRIEKNKKQQLKVNSRIKSAQSH